MWDSAGVEAVGSVIPEASCVGCCCTGVVEELGLAKSELSVSFMWRTSDEVIETLETGINEPGASKVDDHAALLVGQGADVGTLD